MSRRKTAFMVLILILLPLSLASSTGGDEVPELQVSLSVSPPGYLYEDRAVGFFAAITMPDPVDPNTTYAYNWDFDDTVDTDNDGIFDNDNEKGFLEIYNISLGRIQEPPFNTMEPSTLNTSISGQWVMYGFPEPGRYNVTCTLTDGNATSTDVVKIKIRAKGVTRFDTNKDSYRPGETVNVTWRIERGEHGVDYCLETGGYLNLSVIDSGGEVVQEMRKGFELPAALSMETLRFSFELFREGEYRIVADVVDSFPYYYSGMENETFINVTGDPMYDVPVALIHASVTSLEVGEVAAFSSRGSHDPDGEIVSQEWDMGDGTSASFEDVNHSFAEPGSYTVVLTVQDDDGFTGTANVTIVVRPAEPADGEVPYLPVMTIVVMAVMAVAWCTESSRVALLALGLPLYTKLRRERVLDDFTRGRIYGYISANPGEHFSAIKRAMDLPNGTFAHHLDVLEREGFVRSRTEGTYKRYYPADMRVPEKGLKHTQSLILEVVRETPGMSQRDVATVLGLSSSTIGYHVDDMVARGVVRKERRGMSVRYYVVEEPVS